GGWKGVGSGGGEGAGGVGEGVGAQGFEPVVEPLLAVEPLSDDPIDVSGYEWVVVTSANGARELVRRMTTASARLAAVGPGTAAALEQAGLQPEVGAEGHTQEGLVAGPGTPARRGPFSSPPSAPPLPPGQRPPGLPPA